MDEIRKYMLHRLMSFKPRKNTGYYDEDGHCGEKLFSEILGFWSNFKTYKDILYVF